MRQRLAFVIPLCLMAAAAWGQEPTDKEKKEKKEQETEAAKQKLSAFKDSLKTCKVPGDYVNALDGLGDLHHPLILAELKLWLGKPAPEIRIEAVDEISKFKRDGPAARILLAHAMAERIIDVSRRCLAGMGRIGDKKSAKDVHRFFNHQEADLAGQAVDAAGEIRSKDSVDPLIDLLAQMEVDKERSRAGSTPGAPNSPDPKNPIPGSANNSGDEEKRQRAENLIPRLISALQSITGEKKVSAKEWRMWWAKNKAAFKDRDEEANKKP